MKLYHYRGIESAIKEIENYAFRFAAKEELNDPIEGYIRVFWKGDKPAWEGLFRNYICSFYNSLFLYLLDADENMIRHHSMMIDVHSSDSLPLGMILKEMREKFIADLEIRKIIYFYGENEKKCSADELSVILHFIHRKVVKICIETDRDKGFVPKEQAERVLNMLGQNISEFPFHFLFDKNSDDASIMMLIKAIKDEFEDLMSFSILKFGEEKDGFLFGEKTEEDISDFCRRNKKHRNWISLLFDYPKMYINQLKDLIYPEAYVVCFSGKPDNSVMWGNYADSHKGVCLIYETDDDNGLLLGNSIKLKPQPIQYGRDIVERNFFESFGRLNISQIKSWLSSEDGVVSRYLNGIRQDIENWRKSYWDMFMIKNHTKLTSWSYENEYRICVDNTFQQYENETDRMIHYDISSLKGIIFGINTSEYDKMRIIKSLVERKIEEDKKFDEMDFYQANYDEETQNIEIRKINA